MRKEPDVKQRVEQFYKLLASNGLGGKPQRLSAKKRQDIDKIFPESD
jgi:hypothetical protein